MQKILSARDARPVSSSESRTISKSVQLLAAFVLGGVIVYAAGFVNTAAVHNAAHDTRHSQGFPCH